MTLCGKLSSWGIQLPMWAGNLILVSDIHEMHIQLWAGQCDQVYKLHEWLASGISAASDSLRCESIVKLCGLAIKMMLCGCQVAFMLCGW